jgi:hypothetical protein
MPYAGEQARNHARLPETFAAWLRSGVTSVVDTGGPLWSFAVRDAARRSPDAPRVRVAGPLVSMVARPQLDLGDPPIVKVSTPGEARALVRRTLQHCLGARGRGAGARLVELHPLAGTLSARAGRVPEHRAPVGVCAGVDTGPRGEGEAAGRHDQGSCAAHDLLPGDEVCPLFGCGRARAARWPMFHPMPSDCNLDPRRDAICL